jgi:hypothetical protein
MLVILAILFAGEPAPADVAIVISRPVCEKIAEALNAGAPEGGKFVCYQRTPKVGA